MKDKILTIDVGTGSTRAAIVRIDGAMIGFAQREYEQTTPRAGWSEQARLYGGRPPATVYARCFIAIQKRQRRLRLLVLADRCMAPSFWTTVASWWRIGRCCGMISAASRKLTPLTRAKVGKSGWRI